MLSGLYIYTYMSMYVIGERERKKRMKMMIPEPCLILLDSFSLKSNGNCSFVNIGFFV